MRERSRRRSRRCTALAEPAPELAAPILLAKVEPRDLITRDIDWQLLAGAVEHGTGQGSAACALDAVSLVHPYLEQIPNEADVVIRTHKCERVTPLRRLNPRATFSRPIGDVAAGIGHRTQWDDAVLRQHALDLVTDGGMLRARV